MRKSKQRDKQAKISTLLGEDVIIENGMLKAQYGLRIDGRYKGDINTGGTLVIGSSGIVKGNIQSENIVVAGNIKGNINSSNQVHIQDTGRVEGDISCLSIIIDEGAVFIGNCSITKETKETEETINEMIVKDGKFTELPSKE